MRSLFSFRGSLNRRAWAGQFVLALVAANLLVIPLVLFPDEPEIEMLSAAETFLWLLAGFLAFIGLLIAHWVLLACCVKRFRFLGYSGFMGLLVLVPHIGWIIAAIYLCRKDKAEAPANA